MPLDFSPAFARYEALAAEVAVQGIFLAALSNSLVKGGLIALIGGRALAWRTLPVMAAGLVLAALSLLWA